MHLEIVAELINASDITDVTFPDFNTNVTQLNNSILIPASYIKQRSSEAGDIRT